MPYIYDLNDLHLDALQLLDRAISMKQGNFEILSDHDKRQLHPLIYALFCFVHSNPTMEKLAEFEARVGERYAAKPAKDHAA